MLCQRMHCVIVYTGPLNIRGTHEDPQAGMYGARRIPYSVYAIGGANRPTHEGAIATVEALDFT